MFSYLATFTAMLAIANAHMYLNTPARFLDETQNSPLSDTDPTGDLSYPCQSQVYDPSTPRTKLTVGSPAILSFLGESVHGGGSCQISLTTDLKPSKQSDFRVIHSIIGGCPARNVDGNLGSDSSATAPDPYTYNYTIPVGINPGQYTLAWTWFNRIGNREMYMQCAPIEVIGSASNSSTASRRSVDPVFKRDDSFLNSLPPMFLANVAGVTCSTPEVENDLVFPDPGTSVEHNYPVAPNNWGTAAPVGDVSKCYAPIGSTFVGSTSQSSNSTASTGGDSTGISSQSYMASSAAVAPTQYIASSAAAEPTQYTVSSAAPAEVTSGSAVPFLASSGSGYVASSVFSAYMSSSIVAASPAATGSSTTTGSSTVGSCPTGSNPCTGDVVCIGSNQFGLCNNGCAVAQDLAAGTVCNQGTITRRSIRGSTWYGQGIW